MRRSPAAFAALAITLSLLPVVGGPSAAGAAVDPRAQRSELLVRIAELTDTLESTQAAVVHAQMDQTRLSDEAARLRTRVRDRAVRAYIRGKGFAAVEADSPELVAPTVYLQVVARKDREQVARLRAARLAAEQREADADAARSSLRTVGTELAAARAELDRLIAADEARRAAEQRAAEEASARRAAEAARLRAIEDAARASVEARARSGAGSDPSSALEVPRHREATRKQNELMQKYPFGVLDASPTALPRGLRFTGVREVGLASWYGGMFNGRPTASGAIYDQELWTAASRTLPLGTLVVVSRGGVRVLLLINDRGPYVDGRIIDLSAIAARALDVGVSEVTIEVVAPVP